MAQNTPYVGLPMTASTAWTRRHSSPSKMVCQGKINGSSFSVQKAWDRELCRKCYLFPHNKIMHSITHNGHLGSFVVPYRCYYY